MQSRLRLGLARPNALPFNVASTKHNTNFCLTRKLTVYIFVSIALQPNCLYACMYFATTETTMVPRRSRALEQREREGAPIEIDVSLRRCFSRMCVCRINAVRAPSCGIAAEEHYSSSYSYKLIGKLLRCSRERERARVTGGSRRAREGGATSAKFYTKINGRWK